MDKEIFLNLRKFLSPEIVYGSGSIELAGKHAENFGASRVLIVTDHGVQENGWSEVVERSLHHAGINYVTFSDISPNPRDHQVMSGADVFCQNNCDLIVAVGGGSPMDCAKGIGIIATNGGFITDYEGVDEVKTPGPPLVFIPTTAGSSADVSQFAIISDTKRKGKIAIISKMVVPDIALVDPATTTTMSPELTAATGMDALCHAFESFTSTLSSPLTDMAAINAVELISQNIVNAYKDGSRIEYRENMMMASLMAGLSFSNASLGIVHAMAHSLGGTFDLPHGECNALLLEKAVAFNYPSAKQKYDTLAQVMGCELNEVKTSDNSRLLSNHISKLRSQLGIHNHLVEVDVTDSEIALLAKFAFNDPCLATNPREPEEIDILNLFRETFNDSPENVTQDQCQKIEKQNPSN